MSLLTILAILIVTPLAVIDAVFLTEMLFGLVPARGGAGGGFAGRIAILIPAHDEAAIVGPSIQALRAAAPGNARLLLIAHNCSDDTAAIARAAGAEVAALDDPARRGKGYALAFGQARLAADPPEIVIIVDADCAVAPGAIERLAATAAAGGGAVQGAYLLRPRRGGSPLVQVSSFAFLVKNLVRQRGARRIGAPALLTGSGFAMPWPLFASLDLATGDIVEDLALGIDLVRLGRPPAFEERARIWSDPSNDAGTGTQRSRWEAGFLAVARRQGLPLIGAGLRRGRWGMVWMGLHLLTPPLTLLLLLNGLMLLACAALWAIGAAAGPAGAAALLVTLIVAAVIAAWIAEGRDHLAGATLLRLPAYFLWKLALYARLVRDREAPGWVRTARDPDA